MTASAKEIRFGERKDVTFVRGGTMMLAALAHVILRRKMNMKMSSIIGDRKAYDLRRDSVGFIEVASYGLYRWGGRGIECYQSRKWRKADQLQSKHERDPAGDKRYVKGKAA